MKQTQRIKYIYDLLSGSKHTYETLLNAFKKRKVAIGLRQLQRDIKDLELFLDKDERLVKNRGKGKILELEIKKSTTVNSPSFVEASIFKTPIDKKDIETKVAFFNEVILKKAPLSIDKIQNDATSFNAEFKDTSFTLLPLKIIYHNSDYYLGCYIKKTKEFGIFEINQLVEYRTLRKSKQYDYNKLIVGFNTYAKTLFGVTKNIDDNIYKIKLEFSSVTGSYIETFVWHHSQKLKRKDNSIIMTLKCGINRELVGWIFMSMYNVRIVEPPELQDYYSRTIKEIQQINTDKSLLYKNIFV
jgi:predicted DNA-binding transcriptional regulator YafY